MAVLILQQKVMIMQLMIKFTSCWCVHLQRPLCPRVVKYSARSQELNYLESTVRSPSAPFCAIVGGSKVSSKIDVLRSLLDKVDKLIIG